MENQINILTKMKNIHNMKESIYIIFLIVLSTICIAVPVMDIDMEQNERFFNDAVLKHVYIKDDNLFRWNIKLDGKVIAEDINTEYNIKNYDILINPKKMQPGKHTITVEVADSHTNNVVNDYKIKVGGWFNDKNLIFDTPDDNRIVIEPENKNDKDRFTYSKENDKYIFSYTADQPGKLVKLMIRTREPMHLINRPDTIYNRWLVTGNQWLDFVSDEIEPDSVRFFFYDEYNVLVEMKKKDEKTNTINFQSIGDINIVEYTFSFYTLGADINYYETVPENYPNTIQLIINITGTGLTYRNISAILNYNSNEYTPTRSYDSNYIIYSYTPTSPSTIVVMNHSFDWEITTPDNTYNLEANQTIRPIEIANCEDEDYNVVISEMCYQESADTISSCGGKDGGYYSSNDLYNSALTYDGNWSTYSNITNDTASGYLRMIYEIPNNVNVDKSIWQVGDSYNGLVNISLDGCENKIESGVLYLQLDYARGYSGEHGFLNYTCTNSSFENALILYQNLSLGINYETNFSEEGIWWNITDNTTHSKSLTLYLKDEDVFTDFDGTINLAIDVLTDDGTEIIKKYGYTLSNDTTYSLCIFPNDTYYQIDAKIEYYGNSYSNRKYFLTNYTMDGTNTDLTLYGLLNTETTDVSIIVYDKNTGTRIPNAYIKILRYYPNLDNNTEAAYKTVEIEKTDENGETLAKLRIADIWYKFIVEYPAGTVLFTSDVQKILSTEKLLPISSYTNTYETYFADLKTSSTVSCNSDTGTCIFSWVTSDGSEMTGELRIYEDRGFSKHLIDTQQTTSGAGILTYTMDNITGKRIIAEGWRIR